MTELLAGLAVLLVTTIFGIISYFAKKMIENTSKTIDKIDNKLDGLDVKMDNMYIYNSRNDKDVERIKENVQDIYVEIDKTNNKYDDLHTRVVVIETQHLRNHQ